MSVVVVGLEHRGTPLGVLEDVAVGDAEVPKVLAALRDRRNLQEIVLLSTCLRTEVYAVVDRFHDAVAEVEEVLAEQSGLGAGTLSDHVRVRFDDDVAVHLFEVAAGLESAVVGETEVLGQVRRAWERAGEERVGGPVLASLFRHAVQAGRRVRAETAIARGTTSFAHAAVGLAEARRPTGLRGARVVVVGAGEMGAGVLGALTGLAPDRAPSSVVVANRSRSRADELVGRLPEPGLAEVVALEALSRSMADADVLFTAVESDGRLLGVEDLTSDGGRGDRPLLAVDLGMPRNIDPAVIGVSGVTLLDIEDLRSSVAQAVEERHGEVDQARVVIDEELDRYRATSRARGAAPVVSALRSRVESLRVGELERRRARSGELTDTQWSQVDAVTRSVLAKLLHEPTVLVKESAGTPRGERLVEAVRILFDL